MATVKVKFRTSSTNDKEGTIYYQIIRQLDGNGFAYTADDVIDEYTRYASDYTLFNYMERIINCLKQNGKTRTSETYTATLNSFKKFRQGEDIMLDCLTSEVMEAYQAWQQQVESYPIPYHFIYVLFVPCIIEPLRMR